MKLIIIFFLTAFSIHFGLAQDTSSCPCEHLDTNREGWNREVYKNKPCLLDFVRANITDTSLIRYIGKNADYHKIALEQCDESIAMFSSKKEADELKIKIFKSEYFMSKHALDYDTIVFEGYDDLTSIVPVSIEGSLYLGLQFNENLKYGVFEKQNVVSEINIEWGDVKFSVFLEDKFLLFNANFCKQDKYGLMRPIEIYNIGDNKLAIYFHGNPIYSTRDRAGYIAKVVMDKNDGYVGTIFIHDHDLAAYSWEKCENFQGF